MNLRQLLRPRSITVSKLLGGLGNQMFQYAAGQAVAQHHGNRLVLDTTPLHEVGTHTPRQYGLDAFQIRATVDGLPRHTLRALLRVRDEWPADRWFERVPRGAKLEGYWQDPGYFASIRADLLNDFSLSAPPSAYAAGVADQIRRCANPVSIHFRRGDYVSNASAAQVHGTCTPDYYAQACQRLTQQVADPACFVFSDDPEWVRTQSGLQLPYVLVDANQSSAAQDIWLMSLCRHHIVANSSFSWWGAWLGSQDGLKMAPRQWLADPQANAAVRIVPGHWDRI
ncbi:MAG: hypothetical protein RI907_3511 [Pseudomonadota bacterium]|jgi:hypothetical protein